MKLIMHGEGYPCQTLPASDGYIDTDYMGDCMSALVFTDEHDGTTATCAAITGWADSK